MRCRRSHGGLRSSRCSVTGEAGCEQELLRASIPITSGGAESCGGECVQASWNSLRQDASPVNPRRIASLVSPFTRLLTNRIETAVAHLVHYRRSSAAASLRSKEQRSPIVTYQSLPLHLQHDCFLAISYLRLSESQTPRNHRDHGEVRLCLDDLPLTVGCIPRTPARP